MIFRRDDPPFSFASVTVWYNGIQGEFSMTMIGIDLGTTNSLGSVYENGIVKLIPNAYGSYMTPSVVAVDENDQVLVGLPAKKYQLSHPERAVSLFKRKMGSLERVKLGKRTFLPEELSSLVIRSILDDAERMLGTAVDEAVISVPAYFYDEQRFATKKAGALAGVKVERIINEPSSAALAAYYENQKEQMSLVFDFGGGTLDVTVIDCIGSVVSILAIAGDNNLGGSDFDRLIARSFMDEHRIKRLDETEQEALLLAAEQCKIRLSSEKETDLTFRLDDQLLSSHYTLTRLASESEGILTKIKNVISRVIRDAEVNTSDIEQIIMVGGSSKMPLIQSYIRFLFKKTPFVSEHCDELVAEGVGLFCGIKERKEGVKQYILSDICPFSLSQATYNEAVPARDYSTVIIPRNSILPCSIEKKFYTIRDNQDKMDITVLQGEAVYADQNRLLDKYVINIPKNKKGAESVSVRYTYDINGILLVDCTITSTGETISRVISDRMDEEEVKEQIARLEKLKIHPRDVEENKELKERLIALTENSTGSRQEWFMDLLSFYESTLESQNVYRIEKLKKRIREILSQEETAELFDTDDFLSSFEEEVKEEENEEPEEWEVFSKWIS